MLAPPPSWDSLRIIPRSPPNAAHADLSLSLLPNFSLLQSNDVGFFCSGNRRLFPLLSPPPRFFSPDMQFIPVDVLLFLEPFFWCTLPSFFSYWDRTYFPPSRNSPVSQSVEPFISLPFSYFFSLFFLLYPLECHT